jgi:hypothetical protein
MRMILPKTTRSQLLMLVFAGLSLIAATGCDDAQKANIRDKRRGDPDLNHPEKIKAKFYASESVAALALLSFSELHRTTDIMLHGDKAKSLHHTQNVKVDKLSERQSRVTVESTHKWSGLEDFIIASNGNKIVNADFRIVENHPVVLKGSKSRVSVIELHTNKWTFKSENEYSYKQAMQVKIEGVTATDTSMVYEVASEGVLFISAKSQEIEKVQPKVLNVTRLLVMRDDENFAKATLEFNNLTEQKVICGRPIGAWTAKQTIVTQDEKLHDPLDLTLTSSFNELVDTKTKRRAKLAKCATGFTGLDEDLSNVGDILYRDLGLTTNPKPPKKTPEK